jgi:hypothetical protein
MAYLGQGWSHMACVHMVLLILIRFAVRTYASAASLPVFLGCFLALVYIIIYFNGITLYTAFGSPAVRWEQVDRRIAMHSW